MKVVFVDYRISDEERENLIKSGYDALTIPPNHNLYEAISGHPDILLHMADGNTIIVNKDMNIEFIDLLKKRGIRVLLSEKALQSSYPFNIALNALNLNHIFVHSLKYTDETLLEMVKHKKMINVKQGYTKCSTAVVSGTAVMTSDRGIAKALNEEGIDVLLLPPGDILLPSLDYGFIGGCCGLLEERLLAFYGNLHNYAYGKEVMKFLKKHKVEPMFLSEGKLIDRGSIYASY